MAEKKKYDSTVARIAGNIASGIVSNERSNLRTVSAEQIHEIAALSIALARAIVAETERTEPEAK